MKNKMIITVLLILLAQGLFAFGNKEAQEPLQSGKVQNITVDGKMDISWEIVEDEIIVKMSAPTTGWIAIGFDPDYKMKGANVVIGYVKDGETTLRDDYGNGPFSHMADEKLGGTDDVTVIFGSEENGTTTIHFSIPTKSDDKFDKPLVHDSSCILIAAYGKNGGDDFNSIHAFRKVVTIKL